MSILNYTTKIDVEKTVAEIQKLLSGAKAQAIMTEYEAGILIAVSFRIMCPFGLMSFRLPGNVRKIRQVLERSKIPTKLKTNHQAARVAWRIVKDWLAAQLAIIQAEMVTIDQVFLPYAQDSTGQTVYEKLAATKFNGLALPAERPS